MEEFQQTIQGRVPAPATQKFIERAELKFDNIENSMNEITTNMKLMKKDIQAICEKLDENKYEHKAIMDKIDIFLTGCDNKYASKGFENTVTKILWGAGFLVLGAIGTAVFKLIFK